jgi:hypothetical protein
MIELKDNIIWFCFPEIHLDAKIGVVFNRTFRIPNDGKTYPLPYEFGRLPINQIDISKKQTKHKSIILPMWQSEAMRIQLISNYSHLHRYIYPFAVRVSIGESELIGKPWSKTLDENNCFITPEQPWTYGYKTENGVLQQFTAGPLEINATAEEIADEVGSEKIQFEVFPMRRDKFERRFPAGRYPEEKYLEDRYPKRLFTKHVYDEKCWATENDGCFIYMLNSIMWRTITKQQMPTMPFTASDYEQMKCPWYERYREPVTYEPSMKKRVYEI